MHRIARGVLVIAACALLMGFPKVARVHGTVVAHTGVFPNALFRRPKQLKVGDLPTPFRMVSVADGAYVTLRDHGCELTFTGSFPMPWKLTTCDKKDRDDKKQEQQENSEQGQGSSSGQQASSSQSLASSTAGSAGGLTTLQATLTTIAATLAGKEAYDKIKGNGEPLSH